MSENKTSKFTATKQKTIDRYHSFKHRFEKPIQNYRKFCDKTGFNYWHKVAFAFLVYFFKKFKQDRISGLAQALAYTTSLSIIPLFIIFFSIFGSLSQQAEFQGKIFGFFSKFMIPESISGIFIQLEKISQDAIKLGAVGFPTLLLIGISLYIKMDDTINVIWKSTIRRRLYNNISSFIMSVFLGPVLLILVSSLPAYLQAMPFIKDIITNPAMVVLVENLLPLLIGIFIFYLLYLYVPITQVHWWAALIGGITAAFMIGLNNYLLGLYIENFTKYDIVYGSISILPIFLLWIFVLWLSILLGASMAYCAQHFKSSGGVLISGNIEANQSMLNKVLVVLFALVDFFQKKNGAPSLEELENRLEIPIAELNIILNRLIKENLVVMYESANRQGNIEKRFQPAMSPTKIKLSHLKDIYHKPLQSGFENEDLKTLLKSIQLHPGFNQSASIQDIYEHPEKFD